MQLIEMPLAKAARALRLAAEDARVQRIDQRARVHRAVGHDEVRINQFRQAGRG
jgi:hypothetical protein